MNARTALTAAAATLGIVTVTALGVTHPSTASASPSPSCAGVDLDNLSDAQVDVLLTAGWTGDPTDEREELYPAGCTPITGMTPSCTTYGGGMVTSNLRTDQRNSLADAGWTVYILPDDVEAIYAPGCTPDA